MKSPPTTALGAGTCEARNFFIISRLLPPYGYFLGASFPTLCRLHTSMAPSLACQESRVSSLRGEKSRAERVTCPLKMPLASRPGFYLTSGSHFIFLQIQEGLRVETDCDSRLRLTGIIRYHIAMVFLETLNLKWSMCIFLDL